jgi:uncharacterized OB-fold protein
MEQLPVHHGLFQDGHLLGARCAECGKCHFPADADCPYCSGEGCETLPLSGEGTLYLFTGVRNRPPGYEGEVPFGFGVVELPEGLRIIARLTEADPSRLRFGQAMRLVIVPLQVDDQGREVMTYAYAPAEER